MDPTKFLFYTRYKKDAKTYQEIINDDIFLNFKCAELLAYAKKEDLLYIHEYDVSTDHENIINPLTFDPMNKMINMYISDNL
jgi:hypothetical protein